MVTTMGHSFGLQARSCVIVEAPEAVVPASVRGDNTRLEPASAELDRPGWFRPVGALVGPQYHGGVSR